MKKVFLLALLSMGLVPYWEDGSLSLGTAVSAQMGEEGTLPVCVRNAHTDYQYDSWGRPMLQRTCSGAVNCDTGEWEEGSCSEWDLVDGYGDPENPGDDPGCDPTDPYGGCYTGGGCDPTDPYGGCYTGGGCDPTDPYGGCYTGGGCDPTDPYGGCYVGGGTGGNGDPDPDPERRQVNINKMMNCFNSIPNVGAHYSVKLYVDIPDNDDPDDMVEWGNPGHAFVTLEKSNGSQIVDQTFGFYPETSWRSLFCSPVSSIIVNNGNNVNNSQHEYNASLVMNNISETAFQTLINKALSISGQNYDLNDYNCAHYALEIINSIRANPIIPEHMEWDMYIPPASYIPIEFSASPGGLYKRLKSMKDAGDPEANNIEEGVLKKGTTSNGECN